MNKFFKLFLFLAFTSCSSSPGDISDYQSNDVSDGDGPGLFSKKSSKGIYGKATPEETSELLEEGIEVATIPWINKSEN